MIITELRDLGNGKCIVYIDGACSFQLHIKDAKEAGLKEGKEINKNELDKLIENYIWPKARQKVISLIKFKDRTQKEIRDRLAFEMYPGEVIDRAIDYAKNYGLIDDRRYADNYISLRKYRKSQAAIRNELLQKGISKDILNFALLSHYDYEEEDEDPEIIAIKKEISKKVKDPDSMTPDEKEKLIAYLYRKGFELDKIILIIGK